MRALTVIYLAALWALVACAPGLKFRDPAYTVVRRPSSTEVLARHNDTGACVRVRAQADWPGAYSIERVPAEACR